MFDSLNINDYFKNQLPFYGKNFSCPTFFTFDWSCISTGWKYWWFVHWNLVRQMNEQGSPKSLRVKEVIMRILWTSIRSSISICALNVLFVLNLPKISIFFDSEYWFIMMITIDKLFCISLLFENMGNSRWIFSLNKFNWELQAKNGFFNTKSKF